MAEQTATARSLLGPGAFLGGLAGGLAALVTLSILTLSDSQAAEQPPIIPRTEPAPNGGAATASPTESSAPAPAAGSELGLEKASENTNPSSPSPKQQRAKEGFNSRFKTQVVADQPSAPGERFVLQGEPLRTLPGTLGDPLRVLAVLPGVASPFPGLPFYAVRGASPGTSAYFLDGMRLPQLFHLLVGGGVVHAELVEQVDFHPSGYDVRYGRAAGGIVSATTRPARSDDQHFEVALRLYDVSALAELKLPGDVHVSVSGHYGYPGPILHAIDNQINLAYWDYQLRLDWRGLTVQALGAFDSLDLQVAGGDVPLTAQSTRISFHRLQVRGRSGPGPLALEGALVGGLDEAGDLSGRGVHKLFLGWRGSLNARWRWLRIQAGTDGELSRFTAENFDLGLRKLKFVYDLEGPARTNPSGSDATRDELGELGDERVGVVASAYVQAEAELVPRRVTLTAGGRLDVYHAGGTTLIGIDPRAQLHLRLTPWLEMRIAGGIYRQPPSFPLLLPGIDTFALKLGLQQATGGTITEEIKLPASITAQVTGYYQRFDNFTDLPPLGARVCAAPPPPTLTGAAATLVRLTDGQAYGMELLVRRSSGHFTGWIAYTLSRSERNFPCGLRPADYDQTHILNVVAQVRLPWRIVLGARLYVATGRPDTLLPSPDSPDDVLGTRNNVRLPNFVELDLRFDKEWRFRRFFLTAFVEVLNATFSRTVFYYSYDHEPVSFSQATGGPATYSQAPPEQVGFNWILPSLGLRGGF